MKTTAHSAADIDPVTLEVIRYGLVSITNQIDANIKRTAFSPYIYEYNDFAVGVTGPDGQLLAQNTGGMPPFVADSVGMAVRDGIAVIGHEKLHHGDVILCNHAAVQGQHLNNTVMYTPIFIGPDRKRLIGFFAINVHWIDIGGSVPRSSDIFMEGLQLRSIKLWSKGEPNEDVYRIIENNTRTPVELMGDIAAQLAGCFLGRDLTERLAERYGADTFEKAVARVLDQSEAVAREVIHSMPDGVYAAETFLDDDRTSDKPVPIRVKVIVEGDELTVDYSDMAEQVRGPINSGYFGGGQTIARVAFKYLLGSSEMANEGTFRPIKLILPHGKIISADPTAPMGNYSTPFPTVIDAILKALEQALPSRVTGGHFGTHSGVRFHGRRPDGTPLEAHDSGHGGWGAGAGHDGSGPYRTMAHGDTRIIPMELQETMLPFRIEAFSLREDSGGAGKFRGGLGFRKVYRILEPCQLQTNLDRTKFPPWGVQGGCAGEPGRFTLRRAGEDHAETIGRERSRALQPGDIFTAETGGGGGYGDPRERAIERIQKDLDRGYVTRAAAIADYGVRIDESGRVIEDKVKDAAKASHSVDGRRHTMIALSGAILAGIGLLISAPAHAQPVERFYQGNTINIYIGTGESAGAVGAYPRTIAQFIPKYIPGNPRIVIRNMPGAGGIKAANFVYNLAPQDGTVWGFITRGFLLAPLLQYNGVEFDPTKFKWVGSPARTVSVGAIWSANTPVRTIEDAMRTEVVVGATSPGQDTGVFPKALNMLIGTRFKIVTGYKSVGDVDLAMEKGEVQGKVGFTWTSLNSGRSANWVRDKTVTVLVQLGVEKDPSIPADVPLALDLAKTPEDRPLLELLCAPSATGYPSFLGPGVPEDRVRALRDAYQKTMKDPEFAEALKKQSLDLDPIRGEDIEAIVARLYAQPASVIERARNLLPPS